MRKGRKYWRIRWRSISLLVLGCLLTSGIYAQFNAGVMVISKGYSGVKSAEIGMTDGGVGYQPEIWFGFMIDRFLLEGRFSHVNSDIYLEHPDMDPFFYRDNKKYDYTSNEVKLNSYIIKLGASVGVVRSIVVLNGGVALGKVYPLQLNSKLYTEDKGVGGFYSTSELNKEVLTDPFLAVGAYLGTGINLRFNRFILRMMGEYAMMSRKSIIVVNYNSHSYNSQTNQNTYSKSTTVSNTKIELGSMNFMIGLGYRFE